MSEWLDQYNATGGLLAEGRHAEVAAILDELAASLRDQDSLTPHVYVSFELRRAAAASELGQKETAIHHFREAMKIAFEETQDPIEVHTVTKRLMDTICEWQDWALLDSTANKLMRFGAEHNLHLVSLTAGWYFPYALRGLGRIDEAREHAEAILEKLPHIDDEAVSAQIEGWTDFLRSLDDQ